MGKGVVTHDEARETMVITRRTSERLFDFSLKLAAKRKARGGKGVCTCVDKSNVFRAFAFFRQIFDERAELQTGATADHAYIDAVCAALVRRPWDFDVMVTENMFGDILSDLTAGLVGGMGMAPSADIGDTHAVFQPCHGTAPDITGQGKANPTAMLLSAALMLEWLAEKFDHPVAAEAATRIETRGRQGLHGRPQAVRIRRQRRHGRGRESRDGGALASIVIPGLTRQSINKSLRASARQMDARVNRHGEERREEAIQLLLKKSWIASSRLRLQRSSQ